MDEKQTLKSVSLDELKLLIKAYSWQYDNDLRADSQDPESLRKKMFALGNFKDDVCLLSTYNPFDNKKFDDEYRKIVRASIDAHLSTIFVMPENKHSKFMAIVYHSYSEGNLHELITDTDVYIVVYLDKETNKLNMFQMEIMSSYDDLFSTGDDIGEPEFDGPYIVNNTVNLHQLLCEQNSLISKIGDKFGYDCLLRSL
jgi:hypothetical protein